MAYTKIESIDHLAELCGEDRQDFFISLGPTRSSKGISYYPDSEEFDIHHEIDDTFEEITKKNLKNTNIGEAIEKGAFFKY